MYCTILQQAPTETLRTMLRRSPQSCTETLCTMYSAAFCTYINCTAFGNALHFYYTILTFTVLYTVQYYSANCSNVFSCIFVLCCFVQHLDCTVLFYTVRYCTVLYNSLALKSPLKVNMYLLGPLFTINMASQLE